MGKDSSCCPRSGSVHSGFLNRISAGLGSLPEGRGWMSSLRHLNLLIMSFLASLLVSVRGVLGCLNYLLNAECHLPLHGVLCVGESHILCINTSFCKGPVYALTSRSVIVTLKIKYSIAGLLFTFISRFDVTKFPRLSLNLLIFLPHPP